MASFKKWLEGITSLDQVQLIPSNGNADLNRSDLQSKYVARTTNTSKLPPSDDIRIQHPSTPEDKFGFTMADRRKVKPRNEPNIIDKNRKIVPMRGTQIYT